MHERWRGVVGFEKYYEVSDFGRIRTVTRIDSRGQLRPSKLLKPFGRYLSTTCSIDGGKHFRLYVHKEVMRAFCGERPDGMFINHINGNKHDNRLDNLEYITPTENNEHAMRNGLTSRNFVVRITQLDTGVISHHLSMRKASKFLKKSPSYISNISRGLYKNTNLIIEEIPYDSTLCYL